jgi:hypothetical protein
VHKVFVDLDNMHTAVAQVCVAVSIFNVNLSPPLAPSSVGVSVFLFIP